jgi:hypothetical protein
MAKNTENIKKLKVKVRRKGIHAKSKMSSLKSSKNYTKKNVGQGK